VELARVTRVTMLGEITASIAHEVNQPLAAVVMNGDACRRWLAADPPDLAEARQAAQRMVKDAERAGQILARIRSLVRRGATRAERPGRERRDPRSARVHARGAERQRVAIRTELAADVPAVLGIRVQLQQVLVNLILNARDAMADFPDGPAELTVGSLRVASGGVLVEVKESGEGGSIRHRRTGSRGVLLDQAGGLGMGLSSADRSSRCTAGRSGPRANDGPGVTMRFTLPAAPARG